MDKPEPAPAADAASACPRCHMDVGAESAYCPHCGFPLGRARPVVWWHLHRRLYDWTLAWAYRPSSTVALFVMSFAESSFFPIPPDVLLMPLVLGNRRKWFRLALLCTVASVMGAMAGYLIGWLLWNQTVQTLFFHIPGVTREHFDTVQDWYGRWDFWIVFVAAFTPIPFKVITITAGVFGIQFAPFLIASIVGRGARFFLVAGLMRAFGPKVTPFIEKYFNWLTLLFVALLVGGFVLIRYLH